MQSSPGPENVTPEAAAPGATLETMMGSNYMVLSSAQSAPAAALMMGMDGLAAADGATASDCATAADSGAAAAEEDSVAAVDNAAAAHDEKKCAAAAVVSDYDKGAEVPTPEESSKGAKQPKAFRKRRQWEAESPAPASTIETEPAAATSPPAPAMASTSQPEPRPPGGAGQGGDERAAVGADAPPGDDYTRRYDRYYERHDERYEDRRRDDRYDGGRDYHDRPPADHDERQHQPLLRLGTRAASATLAVKVPVDLR